MNKFGFTLAETLITIGIIGVVAAMTIPTLIKKYTDARESAILKEDYSILQQMMENANEEGAMASSITSFGNLDTMKNWFTTYFLPYIKVSSVCYDEWGCWSKNVKNLKGSTYTSNTACGAVSVSFILYNGSYVCMDDFSDSRFGVIPNSKTIGLLVDVNGDKKPNVIGKDIFALTFKDNELLPGGYDMTEEEIDKNCSSSKCTSSSYASGVCGAYCLVKVQRQGFKLPVVTD